MTRVCRLTLGMRPLRAASVTAATIISSYSLAWLSRPTRRLAPSAFISANSRRPHFVAGRGVNHLMATSAVRKDGGFASYIDSLPKMLEETLIKNGRTHVIMGNEVRLLGHEVSWVGLLSTILT